MEFQFSKYHGTGNDFILADNRHGKYSNITQKQIAALCDRRFGIGADGLMLVQNTHDAQFEMVYYNSDGRTSSMCGNGGRCISVFAQRLGIVKDKATFIAIDGLHHSTIDSDGYVELQMINVEGIAEVDGAFVLDTGSPHFVKYVDEVSTLDVQQQGAAIRNSPPFAEKGINVNFVKIRSPKNLQVRTYERGVEAETYSCGTGVVACALSHIRAQKGAELVRVSTLGGTLIVKCISQGGDRFTDVWLCGPATHVFDGTVNI